MNTLTLKANHKVVSAYYNAIKDLSTLHLFSEGAVSPAFASLLCSGARQYGWTLAEKYTLKRGNRTIYPDGRCLMMSKSSVVSGKRKIRMAIWHWRSKRNLPEATEKFGTM